MAQDSTGYEKLMFKCQMKAVTGYDCPGCGGQRAVVSLAQGHVKESVIFYPGLIPILLTTVLFIVSLIVKRKPLERIVYVMLAISLGIILANYVYKMIYGINI